MKQQHAIVGLLAQTSIHAGTGSQTGIIDLPIQREGHNGWPCVFGSAVKGALRSHAEQQKMAQLKANGELFIDEKTYVEKVQQAADIAVIYGAPAKSSEVSDYASAIIVTDARLVLFPVRSLTSQFKWVTCPDALRRYREDCQRLGIDLKITVPKINDKSDSSPALIYKSNTAEDLFLEEYRFKTEVQDLSEIIAALAKLMQREDAITALEKQLVIVSDDSFTHLVNHATPVNAHITLDSLTKTTSGGALWYEETLPPETVLYFGLSANDARKKDLAMAAEAILSAVLALFSDKPYLQLGGNETLGMGWCAISIVGGE